MKDLELSLRIRGLLGLERKRTVRRKKKVRWAEYLERSVPIIYSTGPDEDWVQLLKEKVKNNLEL